MTVGVFILNLISVWLLWFASNKVSTSLYLVTNLNLPFSSLPINSIVFFKALVYGSSGIGSDVAAPSKIVICGNLSSIYSLALFNTSSMLVKTLTKGLSPSCVFK